MKFPGWLLLRSFFLVVALVGAAAAQGKPDFEAARRHYLAGKEANGKGEHERAIREYILAYDITKDPSLFKQIAQSYEASGKKAEAAVYYRRYLAEGKASADAEDVKAKIAALEGKPATPAEPTVTPPTPAEPPPLPPETPPSPTAKTEALTVPTPSMQDEPGSWQRSAGWVSVGLAAVAVTTGSVLATSAKSREEDIQRLIDFRDPVSGLPREYAGMVKQDYEDKDDEGKKLSNLATISFIGAGVFTGAAVLFFILDATRGKEAPTHAHVIPSVGPSSVGVTLGWEL